MQAVVAGRCFGPQNVVCIQQRKGSGREVVNGVHILRLNGGNKRFIVSGDLRVGRASSEEFRPHRILAFSEEGLIVEEDLVTAEGSVPEGQTETIPQGPTVKVKFELHKECHYGQQFNVVGSDPQLGDWEPSAALPLNWTEGHVWTSEADLPEGKKIEYKYILISDSDGVAEWQPGPNLVLETGPGHHSLLVSEPWERPPQLEITTDDSLIEPADEVEVEVSEDEKESVANVDEEVSSPLDAIADAAVSATVGALNASVKAATALEGGIAATPLKNILSKESNGNKSEVAGDEERSPTAVAVEIPVIDAALAATAEVRGESEETEGTTSNDVSTAVGNPVIETDLAANAEEVSGESKEMEEMTSKDASTAVEMPVIDAALAPIAEEMRGESKETEETTSNDEPTAVENPVNLAALAVTAEEVGDKGAPSAPSTGEEQNQLTPVNPFQKDIEWLTKILFGSN